MNLSEIEEIDEEDNQKSSNKSESSIQPPIFGKYSNDINKSRDESMIDNVRESIKLDIDQNGEKMLSRSSTIIQQTPLVENKNSNDLESEMGFGNEIDNEDRKSN